MKKEGEEEGVKQEKSSACCSMLRADRVAQSIINQADGKQHSFSLEPGE